MRLIMMTCMEYQQTATAMVFVKSLLRMKGIYLG